MLGKYQTSKTRDRRQTGNQNGFPCALCQDARVRLFGKPIQNMDSVCDTDADDKRQGHNVGGVEWNIEPAHKSNHPYCPNRYWHQRERHTRE